MIGAGCGAARGDVCPLTTTAEPEGASEYVEPETMIGDEPGVSVCEPMTTCDATLLAIDGIGSGWLPKAPAMMAPRPVEDSGDGDGGLCARDAFCGFVTGEFGA